MDKLTCDIVHDLIPLVLDDVASADSKAGVENHIEGCATCKAYYDGMSVRISRSADPDSDKSFVAFCRNIKRRSRIKRIAMTAFIILMVAIIGVVGITIFNDQRSTFVYMPIDGATAQLYLDGGDVVMLDIRAHDGYGIYWNREEVCDCGDEEVIVYLQPMEPKLKLGNRGDEHRRSMMIGYVWKDGQLYMQQEISYSGGNGSTIRDFKVISLRWGTFENNVELYNAGDIIASGID